GRRSNKMQDTRREYGASTRQRSGVRQHQLRLVDWHWTHGRVDLLHPSLAQTTLARLTSRFARALKNTKDVSKACTATAISDAQIINRSFALSVRHRAEGLPS